MPSFDTSRRVAHSADQMFALVIDVEAYPEFLPLCTGLRVLRRSQDGSKAILLAEMQIGYKAIRERFTTRVTCDPASHHVLVEYVDGPFRYLTNSWAFEDHEDGGCQVNFHIDYEFKSRMLGVLMGAMFDQAFRRFADAFERRADRLYPRVAPSARRSA
jgi:coenzyme Q-binding protein COQ10